MMQMSKRELYSALGGGKQLNRDPEHSTLEVGQRPDPVPTHSTLESREPDASLFDSYKESTTATLQTGIPDVSPRTPGNRDSDDRPTRAGKSLGPHRQIRWILVVLGIIIMIAAAAIGGVVGGKRHHPINSVASSEPAPSSTTTNISSSSNSSSSLVSRVYMPTTSIASSFPTPTPTAKLKTTLLNTTKLASVVYYLNGLTQYRVWFQTEDNMIREIGKNSTGNQWYISGPSH